LRAHTYVGIRFSFSFRDTERTAALYSGDPQWICKALLSSERSRGVVCVRSLAHGLITGQSPTELGMLSNSSTSINVPVLDSGIKQTRIVSKILPACCRSSCLSIRYHWSPSSIDHLMSTISHRSTPAGMQAPCRIPL